MKAAGVTLSNNSIAIVIGVNYARGSLRRRLCGRAAVRAYRFGSEVLCR